MTGGRTTIRILILGLWLPLVSVDSSIATADIFRWDNGQLIPGTVGIIPGPGVQLGGIQIEYANLSSIKLNDASFDHTNLAYADLSGTDLTGANFLLSMMTSVNLAGAIVTGANFVNTTSRGFTKEQLYSTASYQQKNLQRIGLGERLFPCGCGLTNDLTGWDLSGQDLTDATFGFLSLAYGNLAGAKLTNGRFHFSLLADADLTAADLRGATGGATGVDLNGAILRNTIRPDGIIYGLDLATDDQLIVHDEDGIANLRRCGGCSLRDRRFRSKCSTTSLCPLAACCVLSLSLTHGTRSSPSSPASPSRLMERWNCASHQTSVCPAKSAGQFDSSIGVA